MRNVSLEKTTEVQVLNRWITEKKKLKEGLITSVNETDESKEWFPGESSDLFSIL